MKLVTSKFIYRRRNEVKEEILSRYEFHVGCKVWVDVRLRVSDQVHDQVWFQVLYQLGNMEQL